MIGLQELETIAASLGILSRKLMEKGVDQRTFSIDELEIIDDAREIISVESSNLLEVDFLCEESGQDIENN